jgi:DNA-binding IclR family transcriptional regulator
MAGGYAVMNTLRALEQLALAPRSAPELAAGLQIDPRSARRLLKRLGAEGYVVQDGGYHRRYRATLRLAALGRQLLAHATLPRLAAPCLANLAATTSCVAHLWIPAASGTLSVLRADPDSQIAYPHPPAEGKADRTAAATVLGGERRQQQSCTYIRECCHSTAAAAILDRGTVVAALGITGDLASEALAPVVQSALTLSAALAIGVA